MIEKFIYTGPSWAARSYDQPGTPESKNPTNLAKEWQIQFFDLSVPGSTVLSRIHAIDKLDNKTLPIVWVYNEPIGDLNKITGLTVKELIQQADWQDIWKECNQYCLKAINDLNRPILLIGGHSDIVDCNDYNNITVGYHSWQKWLAVKAGLKVDKNIVHVKMNDGGNFSFNHCWGAEVVHKFMHEHPKIIPSSNIVNAMWDIFFFWKELEKSNLFYEVHPNRYANVEFAKFLLPTIKKFLQDKQ